MGDSTLTAAFRSLAEQAEGLPFARETVVLSKLDYIELKTQFNFYKSQHERALAREATLKKQLEQKKAKVRDLNQRLYGRKSEKTKPSEKHTTNPSPTPIRPRGQQPGAPGHGRTARLHLPVVEEIRDLPEDEKCCGDCGLP